jgi:mono/diheme cytochrome c family protein
MTIARLEERAVSQRPTVSTFRPLLLLMPILVTFVLATACGGQGGGGSAAASPETIALGSQRFQGTCATCHGKDANGLPKLGKSLLMNPFIMEKNDDELALYIKTGRLASDPANTTGVAMPPLGGNPALTDDDVKAIVAYLRTLQTLK